MLPFLLLVAMTAQPVEIAFENEILEFRYSWPAEAAAVPLLNRRFRADAGEQRRRALELARGDAEFRKRTGASWSGGHFFNRSWVTAGQTGRLLSLQGDTGAHTGGAHPNSGTTALLWDRKLAREIALPTLLIQSDGWRGAIRRPFCILLDRERARRRGDQPLAPDSPFSQCPALAELTIVPADKNGNGRFDHLQVTADAYVAGPYAEGEYVIALPVTAGMAARLKPEYRASFEAQPPVQ